jgi:inorganic pyrophosphatase
VKWARVSLNSARFLSNRWGPPHILAVATHAHTHEHVRSLDDLRPGLVDEIEDFFRHYNELKGTEFKPVDRGGPKKAQKLLDQAAAAFHEQQEGGGKAE